MAKEKEDKKDKKGENYMAWTVTRYQLGGVGNQRCIGLKLSADAATQNVETGLAYINFFTLGAVSMATNSLVKIAVNSNAAGTVSNGTLGCSGFASGDDFFVTVYGK